MIFQSLKKMLRPAARARHLPQVPAGERIYVLGDIHGRLDLFDAMIAAIEADDSAAPSQRVRIVLLGDLVDRGPDSAGVVARARQWSAQRDLRILMGNHEEMLLESIRDKEVLRQYLKHGGRETLLSYGIDERQFAMLDLDEIFAMIERLIPEGDRQFISQFEDMIVAGDYLFVHAGINPAMPLSSQKRSDLMWIREPFLNHEGPLPKIVVHGHTIFDEVADCGNRIGIDTGAYRTGTLTALVLEDDQRRIIQAAGDGEAIQIHKEGLNS